MLKAFGIPFNEQRIPLYEADSSERIRVHSPSGRLPCLHDGSTVVWDSLSIAEYLAERHPGMWPADRGARAWARSASAEMHSGFGDLRNEFGMNLRVRETRKASPAVASDIMRIVTLWREGRERFGEGGDFLCGAFGIVDAFYCPVAFRFRATASRWTARRERTTGRCSSCRRCANGPKAHRAKPSTSRCSTG